MVTDRDQTYDRFALGRYFDRAVCMDSVFIVTITENKQAYNRLAVGRCFDRVVCMDRVFNDDIAA